MFGRHELRSAEHRAVERGTDFGLRILDCGLGGVEGVVFFNSQSAIAIPQLFGQPPIHHQHLAELADHDVLGFQITMKHTLAVGKGNGVTDLAEDVEQACQWVIAQGVGVFFTQIVKDGLQGAALDELHRVEQRHAVLPHDVVNRHNVGMRQLCEHLSFAQETGAHVGVRIGLQQHDLDGHGAVELAVGRLQHTAHAAGGDLLAESVVVRAERWGQGGFVGRIFGHQRKCRP